MPQTATKPEQFQYVRLPDGSYGKFNASASDNEIRAKITAAFPDAYKVPPTPTVDPQKPWQHAMESSFERMATAAGVPKSPADIPSMVGGMLLPQGDPNAKTVGESIPILGPILTASQQVMNQPAKTPMEKATRAVGSVPFIGPPFYAGAKALEKGDFSTAVGSLINIATQFLGLKGPLGKGFVPELPNQFKAIPPPGTESSFLPFAKTPAEWVKQGGKFERNPNAPTAVNPAYAAGKMKPTVPYSPTATVKPGVAVTGAPKGFFGGKMPVTGGLSLAKRFGLSPELADKIAAKVEEIKLARDMMSGDVKAAQKYAQSGTQGVRSGVEADVARVREGATAARGIHEQMVAKTIQELERQIEGTTAEKRSTGQQLIADTTKAAYEEHQRVRQPFIEIGNAIEGGVAQGNEVRDIITNAVKERGVKPDEIPPAAFKALPSGRAATVRVGGMETDVGVLPPSIRAIMTPEELGEMPVKFNDLTRIREDLYSAAATTKDSAMRVGLKDAAEQITELQQRVATEKGLGQQYAAAKRDYMMFRRGIGSSAVEKWLAAEDTKAQALEPKLAKLTNKATQEALTTVLRSVGIDASNFFGLTERQLRIAGQIKDVEKGATVEAKALSAAEKSRIAEIEKAGESNVSAIEKEASGQAKEAVSKGESTVKELQKAGESVVPGKTTEELAGHSNLELNRMRLKSLANAVQGKGAANPYAMFQIVYGIARAATSPIWGAFHVAYGVGREGLPDVLRDPAFQDWVLKKSGVQPSSRMAAQLRQGLKDLANKSMPASRRAVLTDQQREEQSVP